MTWDNQMNIQQRTDGKSFDVQHNNDYGCLTIAYSEFLFSNLLRTT